MDEAFGSDDADEPEGTGSESDGESSPGGPSGAPTQPASSEVSLASVFGDAPPPKASPPPSNRGPANRDSTGGFSFDEFFEPKAERPSAESRAPRDSLADDEGDEAFQDWLKGLKG